jgi:hypothetical protein
MGKVSIGLRGWRFDEDDVFAADGSVRPLDNMPEDTRQRILRLSGLMAEPCDCCYLEYGEAQVSQCRPAQVIYGEPMGEVLLCSVHETDFVYWFRAADGRRFAGETELKDRFHEWFADGGRAPDGFEGVEHVEKDPDDVPEAPDPTEELPGLEAELRALAPGERDALDVDLSDLDLDAEPDG